MFQRVLRTNHIKHFKVILEKTASFRVLSIFLVEVKQHFHLLVLKMRHLLLLMTLEKVHLLLFKVVNRQRYNEPFL